MTPTEIVSSLEDQMVAAARSSCLCVRPLNPMPVQPKKHSLALCWMCYAMCYAIGWYIGELIWEFLL